MKHRDLFTFTQRGASANNAADFVRKRRSLSQTLFRSDECCKESQALGHLALREESKFEITFGALINNRQGHHKNDDVTHRRLNSATIHEMFGARFILQNIITLKEKRKKKKTLANNQ